MKRVHAGRPDDPEEVRQSQDQLLAKDHDWAKSDGEAVLSEKEGSSRCGPGFPASVKYIVGNEFCERFCYYGMRAVLILYMTCEATVGLSESSAIMINHGFIAAAYLTPLVGGALSDGRKKPIESWLGSAVTVTT
eukprot:jgi/Bigna1/143391/aug1.78_g18099